LQQGTPLLLFYVWAIAINSNLVLLREEDVPVRNLHYGEEGRFELLSRHRNITNIKKS
jgi:hypothetical protein